MSTDENLQEPRFCINCKYIATVPMGSWRDYRCMHPKNENGLNPVTGAKQYKTEFCVDMRAHTAVGCNRNGDWFEPMPIYKINPPPGLAPVFKSMTKSKTPTADEL